tara:strand:- start:417 stop:671 length:255 start_codon:yes stop_codon:yes gene_type:complete
MSSDATLGVEAHARKRPRERDAAAANGGEVIPRLPNHLVVEHILRSEHFDDPADLARLPAVSRATATRWRRRDFGLRRLMKNVP